MWSQHLRSAGHNLLGIPHARELNLHPSTRPQAAAVQPPPIDLDLEPGADSNNHINGLYFRPKCTSECIVHRNSDNPCKDQHTDILHIPLDNTGDYVMFPSSMFHRGYYNQTCDMTIITAQFFCVAKASDDDFRVSRTVMNASRVVQLEHFAHAELLDNLCADLLFNWDEKFPLNKYPPPKKYNLSIVDTDTNRLVKKGQLSNVPSLKERVDVFQGIYTNVEVNSV